MKLLQMSGSDVACSLALSQADHTHCSSRQNGGCSVGDDERQTKRRLNQFIKIIASKESLGTRVGA